MQSEKPQKAVLGSEITVGLSAFGNDETTRAALRHLFNSADGEFELILVDDCSPDAGRTRAMFQEVAGFHRNTQVFSFNTNLEYSGSLNAILSHASGKCVLFLSNDIFVTPAYLAELLEVLSARPDIGIARGVSNFVDNGLPTHNIAVPTLQGTPDLFNFAERVRCENHGAVLVDEFLTGDAFVVGRAVIEKIGTLDTSFYGYFADHDFGVRAQAAGFILALAKGAFAFHKRAANLAYLPPDQREKKLGTRWRRVYQNWERFKTKYELPNVPYPGTQSIPWKELSERAFNPGKHYVAPGNYSQFRLDLRTDHRIDLGLADKVRAAVAAHQQGSAREAERLCREILQADPACFEALHLMAVIKFQEKDFQAGLNIMKVALKARPDSPGALFNLAATLQNMNRHAQALAAYDRMLALNPRHPQAHCNRANTLAALGRYAEAVAGFDRALALTPDLVEALNNRGMALGILLRYSEAVASFERALALRPDSAPIHYNRGKALQALNRYEEAIGSYRRVIALDPASADARNFLGLCLSAQGCLAEAEQAFRDAIAIHPDHRGARGNLLYTLNFDEALSPQALFDEHAAWGRTLAAAFAEPPRFANAADPDRRLRVGYVSGDFRNHSVAFFFEALLEAHARAQVETFLYANDPESDATTARLKAHADHFVSIFAVPDEAAAARIRADGLDLLVDLSGYTSGNRMALFARRVAPVQVAWLGYPNTSGLPVIDYRLTDTVADPPGQTDRLHSERLVRIDPAFLCYRPPADAGPVLPLPARKAGHITFGSFNNNAKLSPGTLGLWARLLREEPQARLVLKCIQFRDEATRARARNSLAAAGVPAERVELLAPLPGTSAHLAQYGRIDIALDPLTYNGTATTCEALWMGVPVVSLRGNRHAARVGASILTAIGLERLIAGSEDEYVAIARELARDCDALAAVRTGLRERMRASPLCDGIAFARRVEAAYREMWHDWCAA
jgi:predicted O-linked N-acetylglucosamine transferase (SPINDLY family)/GT2 family glycosyltransferase